MSSSSYIVRPADGLAGELRVPGDKSVTHRALMLASVAHGVSTIVDPGTGADNLSTLRAMQSLGVEATHDDARHITVRGRGPDFLRTSEEPIDCGNSGTTIRLLSGLLAGVGVGATLVGDESLSRRPMARVVDPLRDLGFDVRCDGVDGRPPVVVGTQHEPRSDGMRLDLDVASAQVKSALLLAGLFRGGDTMIVEPAPSRDHTERMLRAFGVRCVSTPRYYGQGSGDAAVQLAANAVELRAMDLEIPGDLSSAAFLLAAAALRGDEVVIPHVGVNPTRAGILDVLRRMGVRISFGRRSVLSTGEPIATLTAGRTSLVGTRIAGTDLVRVIDEVPVLCVLGAAAEGTFRVEDAAELRVKESDRIDETTRLLAAIGIEARTWDDGLEFVGRGEAGWPGFEFDARGDHRIALAALVAALAASSESRLNGMECAAVSFPDFADAFRAVGAELEATA